MDSAAIGKRRKLALFNTIRLRNGGSNESHITPSNIPAEDIEYGGSDTEDEGDEETAQFYLNKMADDTDRPQETVFGEGVEVWKSHDGTVYADFTDKVKRKIREEETWNQEAMAKVEGGLKRKVGEELVGKVENWTMQGKKKGEKMVVPANPIPMPPAPSNPNPATSPYPTRDPKTTHFHFSSAGIDPLGAHNRPVKPLLKRRNNNGPKMGERIVAVQGEQRLPLLNGANRSPWLRLTPHPQQVGALPPLKPVFQTLLEGPLAVKPNRIVSGSFGSFGGEVSRFDERKYRLLPKKKDEMKSEEAKKEKNDDDDDDENPTKKTEAEPDLFKGKPWLKR